MQIQDIEKKLLFYIVFQVFTRAHFLLFNPNIESLDSTWLSNSICITLNYTFILNWFFGVPTFTFSFLLLIKGVSA